MKQEGASQKWNGRIVGMMGNTKAATLYTTETELGQYLAGCSLNNHSYIYVKTLSISLRH